MAWAENEHTHNLCLAMWEWRMDPVGGRTRLVKDIEREHGASDHEITRAYLRVSAGLRPNALAFQDLDAYAAAWRDALVKELRAYKAAADHCFIAILALPQDEGCQDASQGARAPRMAAQRRAHGAQLGTGALSRPWSAPFVLKFGLSPPMRCGLWGARALEDLAKLSNERAHLRKGPIWAYPRLKLQCSFRVSKNSTRSLKHHASSSLRQFNTSLGRIGHLLVRLVFISP
jgi:hypothetical protein